jgi:hypothetical protein
MDYLNAIVFYRAWQKEMSTQERLIQMMNVVDDYLSLKKKEFILLKILNVQTLDVLAGVFTKNEFSGRVNFDENLKTRQRINAK